MEFNTLDLLNYRIDVLEKAYFGEDIYIEEKLAADYPKTISDRINQLNNKILTFEKELPNLKACHELTNKLKPHIAQKRISLIKIGIILHISFFL
jgi:hypothetical protein